MPQGSDTRQDSHKPDTRAPGSLGIHDAVADVQTVCQPASQLLDSCEEAFRVRFVNAHILTANNDVHPFQKAFTVQNRLNSMTVLSGHDARQKSLLFKIPENLRHIVQNSCHENAFHFFKGVPARVMVDNCKTAVLSHPLG